MAILKNTLDDKQTKYELLAKNVGFNSVLELAASDKMPNWGKVGGKYVMVDLPLSNITSAMMNKEQKQLLEFLCQEGQVSLEPVSFGNVKYNQYVAGKELADVIRQEKSQCKGLCQR